jgi:hypothetical protein
MTDFRGNIEHWIRQAEPDYYMFFLKAWIPFNAWYVSELPTYKKKDSEIIKVLQDDNNSKPRLIIENHLTNQANFQSKAFRSHLAELHHFLDSKVVLNNSVRVTFKKIFLTENPVKLSTHVDTFGNVYKAESTQSYFQAYVQDKGSKVLLDFKQSRYESLELKKDIDFIKLNNLAIQNDIIKCYERIDPKMETDLICYDSLAPHIFLESENSTTFINDKQSIAKGCIKILYSLRNILFHGEIEPNNSNKPIYEHGYHLLRLILKELH